MTAAISTDDSLDPGLDPYQSGLQTAYDTIAEKYLEWVQRNPDVRKDYVQQLFDILPQDCDHPKALELGCGPGVPGTQLLAQKCQHVTAIDISEEQLRLARIHVTEINVKFMHGDMTRLRFPSGSFDVVAALYSLFHLSRQHQIDVLKRIYSWLTMGGVLLCSFQAREMDEIENEFLGNRMFNQSLGIEGNLHALRDAGFTIVKDVTEAEGGDNRFVNHWIWAQKGTAC